MTIEPPNELVIFFDTNILMHFKWFTDAAWDPLWAEAKIRLLVPRRVVREMDAHKNNPEKRERARDSNTRLGSLRKTADKEDRLRKHPDLRLAFAPTLDNDVESAAGLDLQQGDHLIVLEILRYQALHPGAHCAFLTNDTGAALVAEEHRIQVLDPPTGTERKVEPDAKDRRIRELERKLHALELRQPVIEGWCEGTAWAEKPSVERVYRWYEKLNAGAVESLLEYVHRRFPTYPRDASDLAVDTNHPMASVLESVSRLNRISDETWKRYEEEYAAWIGYFRGLLSQVEWELIARARPRPIHIELRNVGLVPGETAKVEIEAFGDFTVGLVVESEPLRMPSPPERPLTTMETIARGARQWGLAPLPALYESLNAMDRIVSLADLHDPHAWRETDDGPRVVAWLCRSWRHQVDPIHFTITLTPLDEAPETVEGKLLIRVTAKNLPVPVTQEVAVRLVRHLGNTVDGAREIMDTIPAQDVE